MNPAIVLADAHLRDGDPEVEVFQGFLRTLPSRAETLILLGDLFDLWIGEPSFTSECHRRVVDTLRELKAAGTRITYIEGNRDYHLRRLTGGDPFDEVAESGTRLKVGGRTIHLSHGDLVNRRDRPYRRWRRVAKGPVLLAALRLLPDAVARKLAARMEKVIAKTNRQHRISFPEEECREFARQCRREGSDTLILGHFHQEIRRVYDEPEGRIEVFVLPAWRDAHRYLRIEADGSLEFASFLPNPGRRAG
jgi:UDP-2,3-diacylglucosamine hydrolase